MQQDDIEVAVREDKKVKVVALSQLSDAFLRF